MRFAGAVRKDIDRWVQKGLLDAGTAERLRAELHAAGGGFGLGGVLGVLGALLLGAAVITLVAANWEAIPRLTRVIVLVALIWLSWLAGAWRERSGDAIFPQVLYLFGSLVFGAGIALVGQMYHLSGDTATAALVWTIGNVAAAALMRSPIVAAASAGTGLLYVTAALSESSWHANGYLIVGPLIAVAVAALSHWNGSRVGKHGAVWLLLATVLCFRFDRFFDQVNELDYLFAFGGAALFFAFAFFDDQVDQVTGISHALQGYALALSFFGFTWIQFANTTSVGSTALHGLLVLGLSVGALLLKGRDNGGVRALAYTAFGAEILYLASVTLGSLIGTSAFFLFAGVLVLFIAWLVVRIEKRIKSQAVAS
ncbi:MAG: DUF2157 domain-containing protein [Rhizobiaceae bacterium]